MENLQHIITRIKQIQPLLPERTLFQPLAALYEECGELSTEISIDGGYKNRSPGIDGIMGESIDAILCLLDIIIIDNPDVSIDDIFRLMNKKMDKWENNYKSKSIECCDSCMYYYSCERKKASPIHRGSKTLTCNDWCKALPF